MLILSTFGYADDFTRLLYREYGGYLDADGIAVPSQTPAVCSTMASRIRGQSKGCIS
jgi:hypothetical protein